MVDRSGLPLGAIMEVISSECVEGTRECAWLERDSQRCTIIVNRESSGCNGLRRESATRVARLRGLGHRADTMSLRGSNQL
jgi:hypothetical protein